MRYIHVLNLEDDEFAVTRATTLEEIKKLGKAGWTRYGKQTVHGTLVHFYKKPKSFQLLKSSAIPKYVYKRK
jgi:hypothetical protein